MSILISAPIRTGKTLYVIKCIFDELNKGRQVYTNIVGINIDGVISVSSSVGDPYDWRNLPNGSVLVWDEAHEHPAFSEQDLLKNYELQNRFQFDDIIEKINSEPNLTVSERKSRIETVEKAYKKALDVKKEEIRDIGRALLMHGHYGIEIYFITQRVTKLNTDVLASVTTHFVMRRKFGMDAALIWEFGEAMTTWSKSTAQIALNKKLWKYPKYLFKFYKSSENHQVRKSFPMELVGYSCLIVALLGFGSYKILGTSFFGLFGNKTEQVASNNPPSQQPIQNTQQLTQDQIDEQNAKNMGVTLAQYKDLQNPEKRNQQIEQQQSQYNATYKISYNPADPYNSKVTGEYQATSLPKFAGCIKYNGKYTAYTEQGTKISDINPSACKRLIDDGDRPYNYFREKNNEMVAQNNPTQNNQQATQQVSMTPQQYAKYEQYLQSQQVQNNTVDPRLNAKVTNGANDLAGFKGF